MKFLILDLEVSTCIKQLLKQLPFSWSKEVTQYVGITLTATTAKLAISNFKPLIAKNDYWDPTHITIWIIIVWKTGGLQNKYTTLIPIHLQGPAHPACNPLLIIPVESPSKIHLEREEIQMHPILPHQMQDTRWCGANRPERDYHWAIQLDQIKYWFPAQEFFSMGGNRVGLITHWKPTLSPFR